MDFQVLILEIKIKIIKIITKILIIKIMIDKAKWIDNKNNNQIIQ
jgi:hypothetical protein